jgi:hypothetical protein
MMSNEKPNDPFGIADAVKQFTDAWNEGLEQAKRQGTCRMRRFSTSGRSARRDGVVFPGGQVVVYSGTPDNLQIFNSFDAFRSHNVGSIVLWIDPEPEASK